MARKSTFEREEVGGIRGLTSLTEPGDDDPIGAVVDVAVIGARGDGKTQFIVHAIRTLRAYAPVLDGAEHQYNRDVLQVVMNARVPRPEATAPGVVPHYVFRIRAKSLLSQIGALGRLSLYARVAGLWTYILLSLCNALFFWLALDWLAVAGRTALAGASAAVFLGGAVAGAIISRQRFLKRGDIELVFWDVAGEHVYSDSAADYYSFLSALVRLRRRRASSLRAYAFAPVLICNPVALGTRAQGSSYARLRKLIPLFASLNEPLARALVAVNRWTVVKEVCAPDTDRRELIAIVPQARESDDELADRDAALGDMDGADAESTLSVARSPLPVVKRDVLRRHCLDAEDGPDNDVHFTYLRYDAGMQCEFDERPWSGFESLDAEVRQRWRLASGETPKAVLDYVYEDGPGAFEGDVRRVFLEWIAGLAFHQASYGQSEVRRAAAPDDAPADGADDGADDGDGDGDGGDDHRSLGAEAAFVKARRESAKERKASDRDEQSPSSGRRSGKSSGKLPAQDDSRNAWKPRPLSATGLEDFARGTIVSDDWLASAIDASLHPDQPAARPTPRLSSKPPSKPPSESPTDQSATIVTKPAATVVDTEPDPDLATDTQVTDTQATDSQVTDTQATDSQVTDSQVTDTQVTDSQVTDTQVTDSQVIDTRVIDTKATEPDAQEPSSDAEGADSSADGERERAGTNPGFGSLDDPADSGPITTRASSRAESASERVREPSSDTLRMPGGFGSGGT